MGAMRDAPVAPSDGPRAVPVRMRVGDGDEYEIGTVTSPDLLPDLLRETADQLERERADLISEENHG